MLVHRMVQKIKGGKSEFLKVIGFPTKDMKTKDSPNYYEAIVTVARRANNPKASRESLRAEIEPIMKAYNVPFNEEQFNQAFSEFRKAGNPRSAYFKGKDAAFSAGQTAYYEFGPQKRKVEIIRVDPDDNTKYEVKWNNSILSVPAHILSSTPTKDRVAKDGRDKLVERYKGVDVFYDHTDGIYWAVPKGGFGIQGNSISVVHSKIDQFRTEQNVHDADPQLAEKIKVARERLFEASKAENKRKPGGEEERIKADKELSALLAQVTDSKTGDPRGFKVTDQIIKGFMIYKSDKDKFTAKNENGESFEGTMAELQKQIDDYWVKRDEDVMKQKVTDKNLQGIYLALEGLGVDRNVADRYAYLIAKDEEGGVLTKSRLRSRLMDILDGASLNKAVNIISNEVSFVKDSKTKDDSPVYTSGKYSIYLDDNEPVGSKYLVFLQGQPRAIAAKGSLNAAKEAIAEDKEHYGANKFNPYSNRDSKTKDESKYFVKFIWNGVEKGETLYSSQLAKYGDNPSAAARKYMEEKWSPEVKISSITLLSKDSKAKSHRWHIKDDKLFRLKKAAKMVKDSMAKDEGLYKVVTVSGKVIAENLNQAEAMRKLRRYEESNKELCHIEKQDSNKDSSDIYTKDPLTEKGKEILEAMKSKDSNSILNVGQVVKVNIPYKGKVSGKIIKVNEGDEYNIDKYIVKGEGFTLGFPYNGITKDSKAKSHRWHIKDVKTKDERWIVEWNGRKVELEASNSSEAAEKGRAYWVKRNGGNPIFSVYAYKKDRKLADVSKDAVPADLSSLSDNQLMSLFDTLSSTGRNPDNKDQDKKDKARVQQELRKRGFRGADSRTKDKSYKVEELEKAISLNRRAGNNNLADKLQKELDEELEKVAVRQTQDATQYTISWIEDGGKESVTLPAQELLRYNSDYKEAAKKYLEKEHPNGKYLNVSGDTKDGGPGSGIKGHTTAEEPSQGKGNKEAVSSHQAVREKYGWSASKKESPKELELRDKEEKAKKAWLNEENREISKQRSQEYKATKQARQQERINRLYQSSLDKSLIPEGHVYAKLGKTNAAVAAKLAAVVLNNNDDFASHGDGEHNRWGENQVYEAADFLGLPTKGNTMGIVGRKIINEAKRLVKTEQGL